MNSNQDAKGKLLLEFKYLKSVSIKSEFQSKIGDEDTRVEQLLLS